MPVVCGGSVGEGDEDGATNECYAYDASAREWTQFQSMAFAREEHAASVMPDGRWFITGGRDLSTTEYWDPSTGLFLPGPQLPFNESGHCQVTIDDENVSAYYWSRSF